MTNCLINCYQGYIFIVPDTWWKYWKLRLELQMQKICYFSSSFLNKIQWEIQLTLPILSHIKIRIEKLSYHLCLFPPRTNQEFCNMLTSTTSQQVSGLLHHDLCPVFFVPLIWILSELICIFSIEPKELWLDLFVLEP